MLIFFLTSFIAYVAYYIGYKQGRVSFASSLCVNIGVFGTFLGVSAALYDMDTTGDIKNTILHFVDSLRLSFLTSVFGVGANILLRISVPQEENTEDGAMYYIQFLEKLYRRVVPLHDRGRCGMVALEDGCHCIPRSSPRHGSLSPRVS